MKLSFKFFCLAYIVVLLATGIGGSFMVGNINTSLWNARVERVRAAVNYAADSFVAFADSSYDNALSQAQLDNVLRQIRNASDSVVSDLAVHTSEVTESEYLKMSENECAETFMDRDGSLLMESVCKMSVGAHEYYLYVHSDFTDIQKQQESFWRQYSIVVICIATVSALLLFALAQKITRPLKRLTEVADEIALGNYEKRVEVSGSDDEIAALSTSVNSMSEAIEQKIGEIRDELNKRDLFVADFTHEMKTPMTAIMGYSQMLRSYSLDETERDQAAEAIYSEAKRLESLSLQLLELYVYKNENVEMESIPLHEIAEQLDATLKFSGEKYNVSYEIYFPEANISGNRVLLLSLFNNLADNALKASDPGKHIKLFGEDAGDTVRFCVEDEGRGIAPENMKLLTEPFFREDKARSRKLGGAGLGLTLCKEIATIHGTELTFESEKNKGTRVSFILAKGGANV